MQHASTSPRLEVPRLDVGVGLRRLACDAIKRAITKMDIYGQATEIRLDERRLSDDLGVSRTPIREALTVLEQEGFVRSVPRRGVYVVRKTKRQVLDMITVWAAIESMAAGMAAIRATAPQLADLHAIFDRLGADPTVRLHEYSDANMAFHKAIIRLGGCELMSELTENLFVHMRSIRSVTMTEGDRARRSMHDHRAIIDALQARDAAGAERLVREHTLGLARHVEQHGDWLDGSPQSPARAPATPKPPGSPRPARKNGPASA